MGVIEDLTSFDGFFERIYGSDYQNLTRKTEISRIKKILILFGYLDVEECIIEEVDFAKYELLANTTFRYNPNFNNQEKNNDNTKQDN